MKLDSGDSREETANGNNIGRTKILQMVHNNSLNMKSKRIRDSGSFNLHIKIICEQ